ncbi:MAG TPA: cation diffusion facilitator family transporter [Thermomicrobiales bacterium]|nr:cation diffusion facilitator family transporter [Thermomicrobiales bacterium]
MQHAASRESSLTRFAWLSMAAAVATISLKSGAYLLTGSVSLLSDALESLVNLVAAIVALIALIVAAKEPDEEHTYGHAKAEYFSSGLEGVLVLFAALVIAVTAVPRLMDPEPIEQVGAGLAVSVVASLVNGAVAWRLFRAAASYRSITLLASARHLITDIWTSGGVLLGVTLVALTGWNRLDALVALAVAANIVWTGWSLVRKSMLGLLDTALPPEDLQHIHDILARYRAEHGIETHALRTRAAGTRRFVSVHVLVPGDWTVQRGHRLLDEMEHDIHAVLPETTMFTHLESLDDPASWDDVRLDRSTADAAQ